jgi:hypothetical protein
MVAFALIDVVPHIAARETHERPREFSVINPKGLFHQPTLLGQFFCHPTNMSLRTGQSTWLPLRDSRKAAGESDFCGPRWCRPIDANAVLGRGGTARKLSSLVRPVRDRAGAPVAQFY